jgi:UDP-N-acetyl-D-galactosamine dehydrogenase
MAKEANSETIALVGLGYVGLPLAVLLAERGFDVLGFDPDAERVEALRRGLDRTREVDAARLRKAPARYTSNSAELKGRTFFIVAVPTPIDAQKRPDLSALRSASRTVGEALTKGATVVYESTVYPGVTEEFCGPILEQASGLKRGIDFTLGYSPERVNPGDKEHTIEKIVKVVSAEDQATLERLVRVYGSIIEAGLHRAPSIKVAEAAKVIENTQRDLNIALMNELALIFDMMGIRTKDVLDAAATKWNFLPFRPGLVGGHCIGVDPYYLTTKAEELGYRPEVILAGRRINDNMGKFVARHTVKMLANIGLPLKRARVAVLGVTFKENVPDIVAELKLFGIDPFVHDPHADPEETHEEYGIRLAPWDELTDLDGIVLAVAHNEYVDMPVLELVKNLRPGGALVDVKSALDRCAVRPDVAYWSL